MPTAWYSTLNATFTPTAITKVSMVANAQHQLAINGQSTVSSILLTANAGQSWTSLSAITGLPSATTTNYSSGAICSLGIYSVLATNGGYLYLSNNNAASYANVNPNTPYIYLPFETAPVNGSTSLGTTPATLTVVGSPITSPGIVGTKALSLSNIARPYASQYIRGTFVAAANFTVSLWFNTQSSGVQQNIIFTHGGLTGIYINTSNYLVFYAGGGNLVFSPTTISLNIWYNVTCIFQSSGTGYMYINNILIGSGTCPASPGTSTGFFTLGCNDASPFTEPFNGYIDDLKIYNTAIPFTPMVPANWSNVAISGNAQYMLATAANNGLFMSSNFGSTWSQISSVALQAYWTGLSLSHSGQYMLSSGGCVVTPQLAGLTGDTSSETPISTTWLTNGVTWATTSSSVAAGHQAWIAFNTIANVGFSGSYSYASAANYNSNGTYKNTYSTTVLGGIGTVYGEWLQLQSSVPLAMYSYSFGYSTYGNIPRTYYIVGSSDATNWYPVQFCSAISGNPSGTTHNISLLNYIVVNSTGTQPLITPAASVTGTFTSYTYSTNAYTYFRIICMTTFPTIHLNFELEEWYINFLGGHSYSTNYGQTWNNTLQQSTFAVPQLTSLASNTWTVNGVTWTASATSFLGGSWPAYGAFNNYYGTNYPYSWASDVNYNTSGVYTGTKSTTVLGVGAVTGEWLQLQSSIPLVMYSYSFAVGGFPNLPKTYYIVGSNDGINWYPIQSAAFAANPFNANYSVATTYIVLNSTSAQTMTAATTQTVNTTAYSYSTNAYTYFRIIGTTTFSTGTIVELGEWYINFINAGSNGLITSTFSAPSAIAVSGNGQYAIGAYNQTPYVISNYLTGLSTNSYTSPTLTGIPSTSTLYPGFSYSGAAGTIAHYGLNDAAAATTVVELVNGYTGTITQTVTLGTQGRVGTCATFNGGYLSLSSSLYSTWNNLTAGTIMCWINPTAASLTGCIVFVKQHNNVNTMSTLYIGGYTGAVPFVTGTAGKLYFSMSGTQVSASCASNTILQANTWYHIAVTFNGTNILFYINGQLDNTFAASWTLENNASPTGIYIGANNLGGPPNGPFYGLIDEFSLWNVALTASNISSTYNATVYSITGAALSYTGQQQVLVTTGTTNNLYYSMNYGSTFTAISLGSAALVSVAMSYDGSYITAASATTVYTLNSNGTAYTVAVGTNAGQQNQSQNSIAIGTNAGQINQTANSIVLSGQNTAVNATNAGFFVAPIANAYQSTASSFNLLGYSSQDNQVVQSGVTTTNQQQTIYGEWIQVQLTNAVSITSYVLQGRITALTRYLSAWTLIGSSDGLNWTLLDQQTGGLQTLWGTSYTIKTPAPSYSYYRIIFNGVPLGYADLGGFFLYTGSNNPVFGSYTNYTVIQSGLYNILQYNGSTVCIITYSWPTTNTTTAMGIIGDGTYILPTFQAGWIVTQNWYLLSGNNFLGFQIISNGPAYEYNSSFIAVQGTSTTVNTTSVSIAGPTTITGPLTATTDAVAQGIFLTPSAENSSTILSYFQKILNTVTPTAGVSPFWASGYSYGATLAHGQSYISGIIDGPYFSGGVLLPNGNVCLVPTNSSTIAIYNPNTNTCISGGAHGISGSYLFFSGVLLPNGTVIFIPLNSVNFGIYNYLAPIATAFTLGIAHNLGADSFAGGILLPNGNVLCVPYNGSYIGIYNSTSNSFTVGPAHGQGSSAFIGAVLLPNGNVVLVPLNSANIGIYNYITNTYTQGPVHGQAAGGFYGGVLLPNRNVVLVPNGSLYIGIYNPTTNTYTSGPAATGFYGGVLLPNGNVLLVPNSSAYYGIYNPTTNTFSSGVASTAFRGGILLPNGNVVCVPDNSSTIGILSTQLSMPRDACLSPYLNKF